MFFFFFQAEDGIRDVAVTGVQTCALPIYDRSRLLKNADGVGPEVCALEVEVDVGVDGLEARRRGNHYTRGCRRGGRRGRDGARLGPGLLHAAETNPVGRDHSGGDHQEHPDEHRQLLPTSCPGRLLLQVLLCVGHGCFLLGERDRATREPRRLGKMGRTVSLTCPWNAVARCGESPASPLPGPASSRAGQTRALGGRRSKCWRTRNSSERKWRSGRFLKRRRHAARAASAESNPATARSRCSWYSESFNSTARPSAGSPARVSAALRRSPPLSTSARKPRPLSRCVTVLRSHPSARAVACMSNPCWRRLARTAASPAASPLASPTGESRRSSGARTARSASATAWRRQCWSSPTLPGQSCRSSASSAASDSVTRRAASAAASSRKRAASGPTSWRRSRSGGSRSTRPFRRK